jgi:deazaflavin-dependent oxidoreductase (nitroreductase family)
MAYLKPPWFTAKVFNKIAMATGISGSETLTITTRISKQPQQIPVLTVDVDGIKHLVSTRGESQWVKNLRANPHATLTNRDGAAEYVASEIPVDQRERVLQAYRVKGGKAVEGYFSKLPAPVDHPVFTLRPA